MLINNDMTCHIYQYIRLISLIILGKIQRKTIHIKIIDNNKNTLRE